jgi:dTDP-4-dehydrorhamnose reductase
MTDIALILGAAGQLGDAMTRGLADRYDVLARTRSELDIAAPRADEQITGLRPDVIINCAAYNAVDAAETHPVDALAANALALRTLARAATTLGATLVHYGTDFVFDGCTERPYVETDLPNPRSTYGTSKLLGEWFAMETPRHYVLRVESLFGGERAGSSIDKIAATVRAGGEVRAFSDRTVSPSYVADVVVATRQLLERQAPYGLYHCVNSGWTTWLTMAQTIAEILGCPDATITAVKMAEAGLIAGRPQFAALSNDKLTRAGILMPTWEDAIRRYLQA